MGQMTEEYGSDLHLVRLTPEFSRFQAALGWRIKTTDHWAPFHRLVSLFGWPKVNKAIEACEPGRRFPSDLERLCQQYARDESESLQPPPTRPRVKVGEGRERGALFQSIRTKYGV